MRSKINWLVLAIVALSFLGFLDATYLSVKAFTGGTVKCIVSSGCDSVTLSEYSRIFGIPVALFGSLYYLSVFVLGILAWELESEKIRKILFFITPAGLLASIWFVSLQLFVIDAICFYCMVSAGSSTLIFILAMVGLRYNKSNDNISKV